MLQIRDPEARRWSVLVVYTMEHMPADEGAMAPFFEAAAGCPVWRAGDVPKPADWFDKSSRMVASFSVIAKRWVMLGPIVGRRDELIAVATGLCEDRDELVRASACGMLLVVRDDSTGMGIPREAEATLARALENPAVEQLVLEAMAARARAISEEPG